MAHPPPAADRVLLGGPIITVDDANPTAEALAVRDGVIAAVGTRAEVEPLIGPGTEVTDLAGRTLVPGFIDGHAHAAMFGVQAVGAVLLAPPDGDVTSIDDVVARLQEFAAGPDVGHTGWVFGLGYDDALLGRHPDRDDLDRVSTELPVFAMHISGHFSAVNSVALERAGYTRDTPDPEGGIIRRRPDGEPNGVLEEAAHFPVAMVAINATTPESALHFMQRGLEMAKSYGYTTAHEGRMFAANHEALAMMADQGVFDIDVLSYIDYTDRHVLDGPWHSREYRNRYRVAGMKITLDGSPQGRTAWRTTPYLIPPEGQGADYCGYPSIPDTSVVAGLFDEAYAKGWQVLTHANGDAAADQLIEAMRPAHARYGPADRRPVLIHGQLVRTDQLDACAELGMIPSLFPMHTFYWGDWYTQIIGAEAAQRISPTRSALDRVPMITSHTDAPVALPNLMRIMWSTVNRVSRSGSVMGPDERLTPLEALKSITLWSAHQHFEEDLKGSLEVGKLADLVVLSENPLAIDPMQLGEIAVLETIKEGVTVWSRGG